MTDERDDENLKEAKRRLAQQPREGSEEAADEPAPLHPQHDLRAIGAVATGWLSDTTSSRHEPGMIVDELYRLATNKNSGLRLFDKNGIPQRIFGVSFDEFALMEAGSDATVEFIKGVRLSLDDLRRWCETPDGQAWCESWGLPSRPVFLFGGQEPTAQCRPSGGRPPKYNWSEFGAEIVRIADMDGLPNQQSALEKIMENWCETNWKDCPGESTIREHIAPIYQYLKRTGWEPNQS